MGQAEGRQESPALGKTYGGAEPLLQVGKQGEQRLHGHSDSTFPIGPIRQPTEVRGVDRASYGAAGGPVNEGIGLWSRPNEAFFLGYGLLAEWERRERATTSSRLGDHPVSAGGQIAQIPGFTILRDCR